MRLFTSWSSLTRKATKIEQWNRQIQNYKILRQVLIYSINNKTTLQANY